MHQTFYIDIEEEISSVVDRLNKSMSVDNYFVVPKRALFLQSIVNLKLLKRESEKIGKQIFIVTQDEIGMSMAERCGISVLANLDKIEPSVIADKKEFKAIEPELDVQDIMSQTDQDRFMRLSGVGSNDFFDSSDHLNSENSYHAISEEKDFPDGADVRKNTISQPVKPANVIRVQPLPNSALKSVGSDGVVPRQQQNRRPMKELPIYKKEFDSSKSDLVEKMFSHKNEAIPAQSENKSTPRESRIKNVFLGFLAICLVSLIGIAIYLFLPSAKLIISPNVLKEKVDLVVNAAGENFNLENLTVPVSIIDKEETFVLQHEIAGSVGQGGKKAHGAVVIYNEFDASPQTLIATTRLESTEGKIFRIQKNVVVPGYVNVGGQIKPGAVSVEIVADQAGEEYNVDGIRFTVPGFKGGPKYDKFYAKANEPLSGGSLDGTTISGTVTQKDLDSAKQKAQVAITEKINQEIKTQMPIDGVLLEQAEKITLTKSISDAKVGDMVTKFNYTVTMSVRAIVFSENDVKKVILQSLRKNSNLSDAKNDVSKVEYGTVNADFDKNVLELRVHGEVMVNPIIESEQIKKDLLGKRDDQLSAILQKYPSIKNMNVEFSPSFVNRIPQYANRVTVEIKSDVQ